MTFTRPDGSGDTAQYTAMARTVGEVEPVRVFESEQAAVAFLVAARAGLFS